MAARVSIGEFSTMTRLSRKALRHYHDLGLLEPAEVDPLNGYRYYDTSQLELARLIRRFRDLEMPVPDLKAYLATTDQVARNAIVTAHLNRMQTQLQQTQDAVAALHELLATTAPPRIDVQSVQAISAIAISENVSLNTLVAWWTEAMAELANELRDANQTAAGAPGAHFEHALFADEHGAATVWIPVTNSMSASGRMHPIEIPGGSFAVATHNGPDGRIDETYAALGTYVAEHGIGAQGPVRERYLHGVLGDPAPLVTEIAWPIRQPH